MIEQVRPLFALKVSRRMSSVALWVWVSRSYLVAAVGEVQSRDVHAHLEHLGELLGVRAGGADGADDLRLLLAGQGLREHLVEGESSALGVAKHNYGLLARAKILNRI